MAVTGTPLPPPEIIVIEGHRAACDGGGGALGHPKVYLEMGEDDFVECGYCDRRFVRKGSPEDPHTPT
ncbi:zinc-finger domain-containing protein [Maricaulis sp. CAU 1757]